VKNETHVLEILLAMTIPFVHPYCIWHQIGIISFLQSPLDQFLSYKLVYC